jgi:hypothetical protein
MLIYYYFFFLLQPFVVANVHVAIILAISLCFLSSLSSNKVSLGYLLFLDLDKHCVTIIYTNLLYFVSSFSSYESMVQYLVFLFIMINDVAMLANMECDVLGYIV